MGHVRRSGSEVADSCQSQIQGRRQYSQRTECFGLLPPYPFRRGFSIGGACSSPRLRHDQRSRPRAGLERKEQTETGRSRNCRTRFPVHPGRRHRLVVGRLHRLRFHQHEEKERPGAIIHSCILSSGREHDGRKRYSL